MGLRITFVLPHFSLSGGDKITFTFANGLAEKGHQVTVVHGRLPSLKARLTRSLAFSSRNFHLPGPKVQLISASGPPAELPKFLPDADLLIGSWWETVESVSRAPASKGRLIHHVQGHEVFPYLPTRSASVYRLNCPKIAVSRWLLDILVNTYGATDAQLVLNPIDTEHFRWSERSLRDPPTIGTVYSASPCKNSELAFEAAKIARMAIPDLQLICFGAERPPKRYSSLPFVHFHRRPPQATIPDLYRQCRFWLFTSIEEGFGLPILEALAVGTPVIATRAGAAPDLVTKDTGAIVSRDPQEMAEAICRLSASGAKAWAKLSRASRAMAEQHDVAAAVNKFEEIICAVASRR